MKPLNDTDIRIASFKDALSIAEVHVQSWKETYTGMIKQEILNELNVLDKQQLWKEISRSPDHKLFIYTENGVVKGFLDGYLNPENNIAEIRAFIYYEKFKERSRACVIPKVLSMRFKSRLCFYSFRSFNKNLSRFFYEKWEPN